MNGPLGAIHLLCQADLLGGAPLESKKKKPQKKTPNPKKNQTKSRNLSIWNIFLDLANLIILTEIVGKRKNPKKTPNLKKLENWKTPKKPQIWKSWKTEKTPKNPKSESVNS